MIALRWVMVMVVDLSTQNFETPQFKVCYKDFLHVWWSFFKQVHPCSSEGIRCFISVLNLLPATLEVNDIFRKRNVMVSQSQSKPVLWFCTSYCFITSASLPPWGVTLRHDLTINNFLLNSGFLPFPFGVRLQFINCYILSYVFSGSRYSR